MGQVNFFTAVSFGSHPKSCSQSLLEAVDSYFYLGGKKAFVIPGDIDQGAKKVVLSQDSSSFLGTVFKVISYATLIIPAIVLIAKAILRSIYSFETVDVKKQLEEGIDISPETIAKIQELMPKIRSRDDDDEIRFYPSQNLVFSLTSAPNIIFKMATPGRLIFRPGGLLSAAQLTEERFANMVKAKEVCLAHQLGLLIIPSAKKIEINFNGQRISLIAEECCNISQNESAQELLYTLPGLNDTARQLATLIAKTGFSDVEWRNMPIIDDDPEFEGPRRIVLIDLEEMEDAAIGIFGGGLGRRGLIRCMFTEEQINIAMDEARRHGIVSKYRTPEEVKAIRLEEIESDRKLRQLHERNGILENPRKPILVENLDSLGLNLEEEGVIRVPKYRSIVGSLFDGSYSVEKQTVTLRQAVLDVISAINAAISNTPEDASLKGKRYIKLDHNANNPDNFLMKEYDRLGCRQFGFVSDEELNQRWLKRIVDALVENGHIYELDKENGHGYFIQA